MSPPSPAARVRLLAVAAAALCSVAGIAQASLAELPAAARAAGLTFALPRIDQLRFDTAGTRARTDAERAPHVYDFAWTHARGAFELRVRVDPEPDTARPLLPHVRAGALVTHLADNGARAAGGPELRPERAVMRWRAGTDDLERLGAEWAYFWDFAPKPSVSPRRRCYRVSYYAAGRGLVHVSLFYDDPDLLHSDWVYVLPFRRT